MSAGILFYNAVLLMAGIIAVPWAVWQLLFVRKRRIGLGQRMGISPTFPSATIWCHAVSVGEVKAVMPMLSLLEKDGKTRGKVILSTVTVTGYETAAREWSQTGRIFYFPLDLPLVVGRSLRRANPGIFITAETEIWPNFFSACFRRNIPVVIVNGRISDRSYSRYMRLRWFFRPILSRVTLFLMQSEEDARRILEMGARPETVRVTGNMKYDREPEPVSIPEAVKEWARSGFLLVGGSTHAGEEDVILDAMVRLGEGDVKTAMVPRHPERFEEVARLLERRGVPFTRYSAVVEGAPVEGRVLLVDAMGVLDGFYAIADAAFVGGSLVPVGGHNLLEPAMHGVPILTGPYTHNFRDISAVLTGKGGCIVVMDSETVEDSIRRITNPEVRDKIGRAALEISKETSGASRVNIDIIYQSLKSNGIF